MSSHESLYVLSREDIPTSFTSGKKNLWAFYGIANFSNNKTLVDNDCTRLCSTLKKSKNLNKIRKDMYSDMIKNSKRVLVNDFHRTSYEIACHQENLIEPVPEGPTEFDSLQESELEVLKEQYKKKISTIREKIAVFVTEQQDLWDGKIPSKYADVRIMVEDQKAIHDLAYEVPKSNIDIRRLRLKSQAWTNATDDVGREIRKRQMAELAVLRERGLKYCRAIHAIDREIQSYNAEI